MRIAWPFPHDLETDSSNKHRPMRLALLLLIGVAIVLFGGLALWRARSTTAELPPLSAPVIAGDLAIAVEGGGRVEPARHVDLAFQASGQVKQVLVKPGDHVAAGQALAQLDDQNLRLQVQQAEADLKEAQAQLDKARHGEATPQDLELARLNLQAAEAQLRKTRSGNITGADLRQAEAALRASLARLDALQNPTPDKLSAARLQLNHSQTALQTTRDALSEAKTNAEQQLKQATQSLTQAQASYATAQQNWQHVQESGTDPFEPSSTDATGKRKPNSLNDAERGRYYAAFVQADAALKQAESAVQQAQVSFDSARQKEAAEVPLAEATAADAQQQLDTLAHPNPADLAGARSAVAEAQAQLDKLRQGGTSDDVAAAQTAVDQARVELERLSAPAAASTIAAAEASLAQAQTQLDAARGKLAAATLSAPFAGTVATVDVEPGQAAGTGAALTLVDLSAMHVDVQISENDIARVKASQPVSVTIDALPDITLAGMVESVGLTASETDGVVTYLVRVRLEHGAAGVQTDMSANASIEVERRANAIQVPSRAITTIGPFKLIKILPKDGGAPTAMQVETGASDGTMTEILSCTEAGKQCLSAGDQVLIELPEDAGQGAAPGSGDVQFFAGPAVKVQGEAPRVIEIRK